MSHISSEETSSRLGSDRTSSLLGNMKARLIKKFAGRDKKETIVNAAAVKHTVQKVITEEEQKLHVDEVRMLELKYQIQPVVQPEHVESTYFEHTSKPATFEQVIHDGQNAQQDKAIALEQTLADLSSYEELEDIRTKVTLDPIKATTSSVHVINIIQPVIKKHTVKPQHFTRVIPSFTQHVHIILPEGGGVPELEAMTEAEWLAARN